MGSQTQKWKGTQASNLGLTAHQKVSMQAQTETELEIRDIVLLAACQYYADCTFNYGLRILH